MKLNLKPEAIKLRRQGHSIADIAKKIQIAESTASLWCREVRLTERQKEVLETRTNRKLKNFFKLVQKQKEKRDQLKQKVLADSASKTEKLSQRELFIAGVALYWAEGFKHVVERRIGFCNSDPEMIKFEIKFLEKCLGVSKIELSPRLTLNEAFKDKAEEIQKFWSKYLQIPLDQFTKPFYQKVNQVKIYENRSNYRGVLRIHVRKSSKLMTQMRGYLLGLRKNF